MNKLVLTLALLVSTLSFSTYAVTADEIEYCKEDSELAEGIMKARQKDIPMETLLIKLAEHDLDTRSVTNMILLAYEYPVELREPYQRETIENFKVDSFKRCIYAHN